MTIQELEAQMVSLMRSVEADGVNGGIEDDPRIEEVGNILTVIQWGFPDEFDRIVASYFTPAC